MVNMLLIMPSYSAPFCKKNTQYKYPEEITLQKLTNI